MRPLSAHHGFTLIELMVAVVVLAIIAGVVVPNFSRIAGQGRVASAANDLLALMHAARLEAVRTRSTVVVCPTRTGTSCAGADWSRAVMFVDTDKSNQLSGSETVSRMTDSNSPALTFTSILAGSPAVVFKPDGMSQFSSGAPVNPDVVSICSPKDPGRTKVIQVGISMGQTAVVDRKQTGTAGCVQN